MFLFNQFHVINSLTDQLSGVDKFDASKEGVLNVRRINRFVAANICAVYEKKHFSGVISTATITAPTQEGLYRIKLYVKLSGSLNSYYANDFVFKGKPFYIEFAVAAGAAAADVVASIVKNAKAILNYDGLNWLKVTPSEDGSAVVFTCPDAYQLFTAAELQQLHDAEISSTTGVKPYNQATYTKIAEGEIVPNKLPFGTWFQMTKDIKLPTIEHRAFAAHDEEQLPIPGKMYDAIIVRYKKDRGSFGGAAVGQQVTSMVDHVFYVESSLTEQVLQKMQTALGANWTSVFEKIEGEGEDA